MSKQLDTDVSRLKSKVLSMGDLAQEMFQSVSAGLIERDEAKIARVKKLEEQVDGLQIDIDNEVVRLMSKHGPVAVDLRFALMVARINTALERVGDQAVNMSEHAMLMLEKSPFCKFLDIPYMVEIAGDMIRQSLDAFDQGSVSQARAIIDTDDKVDALYDQMFRVLLTYMMADPENIPGAMALLMIARCLERIADYATNIAEEVVFMVKGEDIRHAELQAPAKAS